MPLTETIIGNAYVRVGLEPNGDTTIRIGVTGIAGDLVTITTSKQEVEVIPNLKPGESITEFESITRDHRGTWHRATEDDGPGFRFYYEEEK